VIERARAILGDLERDEEGLARRILAGKGMPAPGAVQLSLYSPKSEIEKHIASLELDTLAPIEALLQLRELKRRIEQR
jgi:hypothetical protein